MSVRALTWAWDQPCPSPLAKLVLLRLCDYANEHGECWPSQGRIAEDCGMCRSTVNRQIKALVDAGLIDTKLRTNKSGKHSSRYFIRCSAERQRQALGCNSELHSGNLHENAESEDFRDVALERHPDVAQSDREPVNRRTTNREDSQPEAGAPPRVRAREAPAAPGSAPREDLKILDYGCELIGASKRALVAKMLRRYGASAVSNAFQAIERRGPDDPAAFFIGCFDAISPKGEENGGYREDTPEEREAARQRILAGFYQEKEEIHRDVL